MNARSGNLDVIHHGMVLLSDGKGRGQAARLELTKDSLNVYIATDGSAAQEFKESSTELENGIRTVKLKKKNDGGLGLSIKGGLDGNQQVPVVISKIFPNMPADESGLIFVGDAIAEVNGKLVDGKTHEEVVQMLREAGDEVALSVRHYTHIAPYMKPAHSLRQRSSSSPRLYEPSVWKSALKLHSSNALNERKNDKFSDEGTKYNSSSPGLKTTVRIPLPMAFITRYLWGTDKIRNDAFEVRAVDGTSTGIVHCEDRSTLDLWIKYIESHIVQLNQKSINISNKYIHKNEQIIFIGWLSERLPEEHFEDPRQRWEPHFLILKGAELCIFESPPLNNDDLTKCVSLYKIYDTALKEIEKDKAGLDKRDHCFWIETSQTGIKHYLSAETHQQYGQFVTAYHRCLYMSINNLQTKTFACNYDGRPCGLVLDIKQGISLYDVTTKRYTWQYRFNDLESSSDDGKIRLRLVFHRNHSKNDPKIVDIESDEVLSIAYTMHAFFVAKIIACDPDYLKTIPLN